MYLRRSHHEGLRAALASDPRVPRSVMSSDRYRPRLAGVCGEYGSELIDERDGEGSVVWRDRGAVRVLR